MAWASTGLDATGLIQPPSEGSTPSVPALATHRGSLWCLWSSPSGHLYYAVEASNSFGPRIPFPDQGIPVLAELLGTLHTIIIRDSGDFAHYVFDDDMQAWAAPAIMDRQVGFYAHSTPALVAFHNRLVLVFIHDYTLYYSVWIFPTRERPAQWSYPQEVSGIRKVTGIPALFVLKGLLHVICAANDESREFLGFAYTHEQDIWNSCDDVSEGKAASGVSATSYGDSAFLAFQENGPDDTSHLIYVSEFKNGAWKAQEAVAGQTSADPPQLAVSNGRINCIFNTNDEGRELRWYSRSLLEYSLGSWMKEIPGDTLLSAMTIPGTHDSCAQSSIPFVRTQYLSITKQMEAGLRFLDLRLRAHADGILYCYHGGIPINMPMYLKFETVMHEVFTFMEARGAPTEAVLVSINNDDTSGKEPPYIFYNAVEYQIKRTPKYSDGSERWITARKTVTLGEARGKAVLLRRYQAEPELDSSELIGIDLHKWLNDDPDFTLHTPEKVFLTIQDKWKYSKIIPLADLIASKYSFVREMLEKAAAGAPEHWFLNFMSAVGDPVEKGEIAESHWIAVGAHSRMFGQFVNGMNVTVRKEFNWQAKTRYGIIAMDYPELPKDSDLIARLIGTNM